MSELPEITEAKKRVMQVVEIMILADYDLKRIIKKYLDKLTDISMKYDSLGKQFTFYYSTELYKEINSVLSDMKIELFSLINHRSNQADFIATNEEKEDKVHPFMYVDYKGGNVEGRIARYISNFAKEAEVYIAIGLANRLSKDSVQESYLSNMKKPYKSQEFIDALKEGGYEAERIKSKGLSYGKYIPAFVGLKMLEQDSIYKAYNYSLQDTWVKGGNVIGWYTVRGSNYPCPDICDPMVGVIHPINEPYYGYHPRCVCPMIPVHK